MKGWARAPSVVYSLRMVNSSKECNGNPWVLLSVTGLCLPVGKNERVRIAPYGGGDRRALPGSEWRTM